MKKAYDKQGNAAHYNTNRLQMLTKVERTYGTEAAMLYCEISADKYRERIGKKKGAPLAQEVMKIHWYERTAATLFAKLHTSEEVVMDNRTRR